MKKLVTLSLFLIAFVTLLAQKNKTYTSFEEALKTPKLVYSLYLSDQKLPGLIESIGQLTNLTSLAIRDSRLTILPESIGQLDNLTRLSLANNGLTNLPESIGKLTKLTMLDLFANPLTSLPNPLVGLPI